MDGSKTHSRPSDRERILSLLKERGSVDSHFLRTKGFSGNPSQRIRELKADGWQIDAERFKRPDGRWYVRYTLVTEEAPTTLFACDLSESPYW